MVRFLLIEPGATDFDDQGRMKGSMDMPLSSCGRAQVETAVRQLSDVRLEKVYSAPCQSARETAATLARWCGGRVKVVDCLRNIDHGLWHGKKIDEVRTQLPKIYRTGQDHPDKICPPGGESLDDARHRVDKLLNKLQKKYRGDTVGLVVPDPLASVVRCLLRGHSMGNLWHSETDAALWEIIDCEAIAVGS
jgi:broad specificity phosphatase PhoE